MIIQNTFEEIVTKLTLAGFSIVTITASGEPQPFVYLGTDNLGFLEYDDIIDSWEVICTSEIGFTLLNESLTEVAIWAWYGDAPIIANEYVHTLLVHQS